ncbi:hypothetical protein D3C80_1436840 [compost metagenome]
MRKSGQVIHADNEDVPNTTILEFIEHAQPELRGLILPDPHAQDVLVSVQIDANDHVGSFVDNGPVLLDLEVDRIQIDDRVDAL